MDDFFDFVCVSLAFKILYKIGSLFNVFFSAKGGGPFGDDDDDDDEDHDMLFLRKREKLAPSFPECCFPLVR